MALLRTTARSLSGLAVFLQSRILINMKTFRVVIDILHDVRREKSDKGWSLSSDVELKVKVIAKRLDFSDDNEITSGLFMKFLILFV